jgi:hypothetical protein
MSSSRAKPLIRAFEGDAFALHCRISRLRRSQLLGQIGKGAELLGADGPDVGGESVRRRRGASIKAQGKKKSSNHSPKDWLEPSGLQGLTPWLSGRNQFRAWCLCGSPHHTFGPHFDQLSAKNTPALTGVRAGASA